MMIVTLAWLGAKTFVASADSSGAIVWIALAALLVSVGTFIASQRDSQKRAKVDYVNELETRIADCERDRTGLHNEVGVLRTSMNTLRDENIELMRRLVNLEKA